MPQTSVNAWLYKPRPIEKPRIRLFCFHYAGGSAQVFRSWSAGLPEDLEVCAVQLPGRGARFSEKPFRRMEPLLVALEEALGPTLTLPYAFFGHSFGALVAFELIRRLRRSGLPLPVHFFASARRAPQLTHEGEPMHTLPDKTFLAELRRYNGIPEVVLREPELLALLLPVVRADFEVLETCEHKPESPLSVPITALGGHSDREVSQEELSAWREQTNASFSMHLFPGDHFFLQTAQRALYERILASLSNLV